MRAVLPTEVPVASKSTDTATDKFVSDDGWFSTMVAKVFGPGSGTTMAILTDVDERYCWRYASPTQPTQPKALFLALLLRSERGGAVLEYLMDGCQAAWWRQHNAAARKAGLLEQVADQINRELSPPRRADPASVASR